MFDSQLSFLIRRILFTIFAILIYRIGIYIPLPYGSVLTEKMLSFFNMFNLFSGGTLSKGSIFSLNIMPYIVSSIVSQLFLSNSKNDDSSQSTSKNKFKIRLLTMCLAFLQASFLVFSSNIAFKIFSLPLIINLLTLVAGSLLLMWLGELITLHGIGNGISLIIFVGIVAEVPVVVMKNFKALSASAITLEQFLFSLSIVVCLIFFIVFIESSMRNIPVNYLKQKPGMKTLSGAKSYIPLRINTAGVIPPIFANAVLMFPLTILGFYHSKNTTISIITGLFAPGKFLYELLYILLIVFFCFFYTFIVFDPDKAAATIKKSGGVVFGYRPGVDTSAFLRAVVGKLTVIGAFYIVVICMSTEIMRIANMPSFIIGGTSLLIVVGVVIDTIAQMQVYLFSGQYGKISKKTGLRRRGG
ncbi:Protein translocase subunit SecY [Candidatus Xenohaliotis californiensis]|uniref:Protein translocase subunit SecY n=1 Tax=Candidatus Xenohaliotis californiensis TaxID=84677 RepID=A0ABP0ET98_9RICK|nr:Protein translocase subunit SecY [Candidatus Xenohaliotis californiensis]